MEKVMKGRYVARKPKLLWIGDAVAHTGFAKVTHSVLDHLYKDYDIDVLGINYNGDPHPYPYRIWPAYRMNGDLYGMSKLPSILNTVRPDLIVILNDPWICKDYIEIIDDYKKSALEFNEKSSSRDKVTVPKVVVYTPIDAKNIRSEFIEPLNSCDLVIAYTNFGLIEMRKGGLVTDAAVIPHGVDTDVFKPVNQKKARANFNIPDDWFIVGNVNRNQPRKRIDLTVEYFAAWAKDKPDNVKFYYHGALQDSGWDIINLCRYYHVEDRLIITSTSTNPARGVPLEVLNDVYNTFDVQVTTTMGEGWGLTTMEGMACKVPQIVPKWSALGEWVNQGAIQVPCLTTAVHTGGINTVGGIPDKKAFVEALEVLYSDKTFRLDTGELAHQLVTSPDYNWSSIAKSFDSLFKVTLNG